MSPNADGPESLPLDEGPSFDQDGTKHACRF
jgi:hypothetical protein